MEPNKLGPNKRAKVGTGGKQYLKKLEFLKIINPEVIIKITNAVVFQKCSIMKVTITRK